METGGSDEASEDSRPKLEKKLLDGTGERPKCPGDL